MLTVTGALGEVAKRSRSFYEGLRITLQNDGTLLVDDDYNSVPDDLFCLRENELHSDYSLAEYEHSDLIDQLEYFDNSR